MMMAKKIKNPTFEQALRDLPECVDVDLMAMKTIDDLRWSCLIQLDLIEEGQDSTEHDDPKAIKRWLKKYSSKAMGRGKP